MPAAGPTIMKAMNGFKPRFRVSEVENELELAWKADRLLSTLGGRLPSTEDLQALTESHGPALASMLLHRSLLAHSMHGEFIRHVGSMRTEERSPLRFETTALIVPGASGFLRPDWGGGAEDLRRVARSCGFATEVASTRVSLSLSENARVLRETLARPDLKDVVLLTCGRGTAETRFLLHKLREAPELKKVRAWVNILGDFNGSAAASIHLQTPFARLKTRLACRWRGVSFSAVQESAREFPYWSQPMPVPRGLLIVSVVGIPMREHIPVERRELFDELSKLGPNDGDGLILDKMAHPGFVYPILGLAYPGQGAALLKPLARILNCLKKTGGIEPALDLTPDPSQAGTGPLELEL